MGAVALLPIPADPEAAIRHLVRVISGRARAEHDARAAALRAVLKDFEAICEHIADAEGGR